MESTPFLTLPLDSFYYRTQSVSIKLHHFGLKRRHRGCYIVGTIDRCSETPIIISLISQSDIFEFLMFRVWTNFQIVRHELRHRRPNGGSYAYVLEGFMSLRKYLET